MLSYDTTFDIDEATIEINIEDVYRNVDFENYQEIKIREDVEYYTGSYSVTPKPDEKTTLATKDKFLSQNVVVQKIPYYEVDNQFNGTTVIIGGENIGT